MQAAVCREGGCCSERPLSRLPWLDIATQKQHLSTGRARAAPLICARRNQVPKGRIQKLPQTGPDTLELVEFDKTFKWPSWRRLMHGTRE